MALAKSAEAQQRMNNLESFKLEQLLHIMYYITFCLSSYLAWRKKYLFPPVTPVTFENPPQ